MEVQAQLLDRHVLHHTMHHVRESGPTSVLTEAIVHQCVPTTSKTGENWICIALPCILSPILYHCTRCLEQPLEIGKFFVLIIINSLFRYLKVSFTQTRCDFKIAGVFNDIRIRDLPHLQQFLE